MVAERKWVDRLIVKNQHAQGVPLPSYRNKKGDGCTYIEKQVFNALYYSACQSRLAM